MMDSNPLFDRHVMGINEGKEVSEWIWLVSSVTEVLDFLEYVFVGTRTSRYSSKDEEFEEGPPDVQMNWSVRQL